MFFKRLLLPLLFLLPLVAQAQFNFTTNNGAITITQYTGSGGAVIIPSATNGLPVTTIENESFYNSINVTSVALPDSIITIGNSAFLDCWNLASVTISTNLTSIGINAFSNRSLTNITIPTSITSINPEAFLECGRRNSGNNRNVFGFIAADG